MKQVVMGVTWRKSVMHVISLQSQKKRDPLENTDVEGRRLLKWILINRMAGCDWINLARNRDKW